VLAREAEAGPTRQIDGIRKPSSCLRLRIHQVAFCVGHVPAKFACATAPPFRPTTRSASSATFPHAARGEGWAEARWFESETFARCVSHSSQSPRVQTAGTICESFVSRSRAFASASPRLRVSACKIILATGSRARRNGHSAGEDRPRSPIHNVKEPSAGRRFPEHIGNKPDKSIVVPNW